MSTTGEHQSSLSGALVSTSSSTTVSPYTLSSSDNRDTVTSYVQLNREEYNEWSEQILNALQAKRKTGFIDGSITKPAKDDPNFDNWKTVNSMTVGWIPALIEPKVKSTVTFISDANLLWDELRQRFSVSNNVHVHQIKAQLASCRQEGQAVIDYYGKLCNLWDELKNYQASAVCPHGSLMSALVKFVMGLDDSRFGGICTSLINMDPLSSLVLPTPKKYAKNIDLLRHDIRNNGRRLSHPVLCSHCGRTVYEKKDCWSLVGFPDWWTDRNGVGRGSGGRGRGGRGAGRGRGKIATAHATSSNPSALPEFTPDQLHALSQLLQERTSTNSSDKLSGKPKFGDVILDTRASHHMTGNLTLLTNVGPISPCSVGFADGSKTIALSMGEFPLSEKISLTNVLYVPTLNCTLISVSKIDRFSRILIGRGEERDGVYYLTDVATAKIHTVNVSSDQALWHQRLGHPSSSVLLVLPMVSVSGSSNSSLSDRIVFLLPAMKFISCSLLTILKISMDISIA
ncbi:PREDICTED: uncharacterized protein LOC104748465 [Camelina sativa]|uniref:Uncharacterized protein LOC104748465 n=1 Tax=Camelina sativa TaxID=90675 RepID=A0ABM0WB31_CAMSA|nr:PREDICTED: uncharacterized protein LOC104748465 [Camelina sativa]